MVTDGDKKWLHASSVKENIAIMMKLAIARIFAAHIATGSMPDDGTRLNNAS